MAENDRLLFSGAFFSAVPLNGPQIKRATRKPRLIKLQFYSFDTHIFAFYFHHKQSELKGLRDKSVKNENDSISIRLSSSFDIDSIVFVSLVCPHLHSKKGFSWGEPNFYSNFSHFLTKYRILRLDSISCSESWTKIEPKSRQCEIPTKTTKFARFLHNYAQLQWPSLDSILKSNL